MDNFGSQDGIHKGSHNLDILLGTGPALGGTLPQDPDLFDGQDCI